MCGNTDTRVQLESNLRLEIQANQNSRETEVTAWDDDSESQRSIIDIQASTLALLENYDTSLENMLEYL